MYLMSDDNECRLYNSVSNVKEYCQGGGDHGLWGGVKDTDGTFKSPTVSCPKRT